MFAHAAPSSESRLRNRRGSELRVSSEFHYGRPVPSVWRDRVDQPKSRLNGSRTSEEDGSALASSFPLIFFGAGLTFVGFYIRSEDPSAFIARLPLWVPFLLLGLIALGGGVLSIFAKPGEGTSPTRSERPERDHPPRIDLDLPPTPPRRSVPTEGRYRDTPTRSSSPVRAAPMDRPVRREFASAPGPGRSEPIRASMPEESSSGPFDFSSLLRELESIDDDLRGPPQKRPPSPTRPRPEAGEYSAEGAAGSTPELPASARDDALSFPRMTVSPPPSEPTTGLGVSCIGCGGAIPRGPPSAVCGGCDQPLCSECLGRSEMEGQPVRCPFCSALDSIYARDPKAATTSRERR